MISISSVPSQGIGSRFTSFYRLSIAVLLCVAFVSVGSAQSPFPTSHFDNQRTAANTTETLLTPANVNSIGFGQLFNYPLDFAAVAQPLYMPNVNIPGQGTHNVVYVATMADSVYAFDADNNLGAPLWWTNFTNPAAGITTASGQYLPCSGTASQEGVPGTPAIDINTNTIYLVAKTVENGTVVHRLHALDITTGQEKFGGPTLISATSVSLKGHVTVFNSLHQKQRPGLLLSNGAVYIGFGSNGCNDGDAGWLLAYDATSLQQVGVFNVSPDTGLGSIWQTGTGVSSDEFGNVYAISAETSLFDIPNGGQSYSHTVLQFNPAPAFGLNDYFTPSNVAFLNAHDLDLSSGGPVILPDQAGPYPHLMVAAGKQGTIYVLNRDAGMMGQYSPSDMNVEINGGQELDFAVGNMFGSPTYWNGTLYYAGNSDHIQGFSVGASSTTPLSPAPVISSPKKYQGSHSASISANGNTNGVLWVISGNNLFAFNATTLAEIYNTSHVPARDALTPFAHFITQTVANGKVYVGTQTLLQVYGLLSSLSVIGGNNQTGPVLTTLPAPLQLQVINPYSGTGIAGVTVTFSDGGKKGVFNPPSAMSDGNGNVSTTYTLPKTAGTYTITASAPNAASMAFTETAISAGAARIITYSGNKQTQQAGSVLAAPLRVKIEDASGNGVPGVTATFVDPKGGTFNPTSGVSDAKGLIAVSYQLPNAPGTYKLIVNSPPLKAGQLTEYATGDSPANLVVTSGNNQSALVNSPLASPIVVQVQDAGAIPIPGVSVVFSAPTGTLSATTVTSDSNGNATVNYTTGSSPGTFTINAAVNAVNTQITVNVTSQ